MNKSLAVTPKHQRELAEFLKSRLGAEERKPEQSNGKKRGKKVSAAQYTYEAAWSEEERTFIARVAEFPSLEARGDSRGISLRALKSVVDAVLKDLAESGEDIPKPEQNGKKRGKK